MRITSVTLNKFKRFTNANITNFHARFESPVIVITGSNGSGKSSLLKELNLLPSVRSDYGPGGFKEIHAEHQGHQYILGSYFENRQSPHSFKVDGVELNTSGTTEVQLELVEKHFGINNVIRNLITSKIQMCNLTRAGRKDLLLHANPMDLGLILDTHKIAQQRCKDSKAQLQMLYLKKQELEGKLIPPATLAQHKETQTKLNNQLLALDKIIYGLEQHIRTLQDRFKEELQYKEQCTNNNQQLIPTDQILNSCKNILAHIDVFTKVARGDEYLTKREQLHTKQSELTLLIDQLKSSIASASQEINEYTQHLDKSADRPISTVEKEIAELDIALQKYDRPIEDPVPLQNMQSQLDLLEEFQKILFVFRDCEIKLNTPAAIDALRKEANEVSFQLKELAMERQRQLAELKSTTEDLEKRINSAGIPKNCTLQCDCGLANVFSTTFKALQDRKTTLEESLNKTEKPLKDLEVKYASLAKLLDPIDANRIPEMYSKFKSYLSSFYLRYDTTDDDMLVRKLNNQPLSFYTEIKQFLDDSKLTHERRALEQKKQGLTTELQALMKSGGASLEFMQKKLKEKEALVKTSLDKLKSVEEQKTQVDEEYNLYVEYALAADRIKEFQRIYTKGEQALLVSKAIEYWKNLGRVCLQLKTEISEELRKIESLVREQETTAHVFNAEIAPMITQAEENRRIYEKLEVALSPTTGIPHRSMVKYLNALINNVNAFVSQMWTYRMRLFNVKEDEPLDYNFRLEIKNDAAGDINVLSKGQREVMDLAWILTILLQLRMLNNVPLFGDELGASLDTAHRNKLIKFLGQLLDNKLIDQIFLVSHFALFTDGFSSRDIVCLNGENLSDLPQETNRLVTIE